MRKPERFQKVTPNPYFEIRFGCTNRAFRQVLSDLYAFGDEIDVEVQDGYISEKCDYEGDLERIIIYSGDREEAFHAHVAKKYGVDPQGLDIHLTCF